MENIELFNLKRQTEIYGEEYLSAIREVMLDARFSGGTHVEKFEREFSLYNGARHTVCVNCGTSALFLALRALGIGPGDEVIIPSNTFVATAWSAVYNGAVPVFCDCLPDTWEIDVNDAERRITGKTKAVIGVHLYGLPCEVNKLRELAKANSLLFIEDCAQADGALYYGKHVGTLSDAGCFSFYPTKNLGSFGEGGCIITGNEAAAEKAAHMRAHCATPNGDHTGIGFNMRMDGIQATILSIKLARLDSDNRKRAEIAGIYRREMRADGIVFQHIPENCETSNHLFVISVPERDKFIEYMRENGICCGIHYPIPCHKQSVFTPSGQPSLPNSEYISAHCVSVPLYPELTESEIEKICECADKAVK